MIFAVFPFLTGAVLGARGAFAQQAIGESVLGRSRPEYDPLGIYLDDAMRVVGRAAMGRNARPTTPSADTLGSFLLKTDTTFSTEFDDNVFRDETGQVSDVIFVFSPSLTIDSDWANHQLKYTLGGSLGRYADNGTENFEDFNTGLSGRLDVDQGETLNLTLDWAQEHEERDSLDDAGEAKPTVFQSIAASAVYAHDKGEIFSRTTFSVDYKDYIDSGATNNDDRDLLTYDLRQRIGHDVDEGSQIFIEGALTLDDFIASRDDAGKELGSNGGEALVGLTWDASGVSFAEFGIGYLWESFADSDSADTQNLAFRGRGVWNITGLTTLTVNASREVEQTTQAGASSILTSIIDFQLDWEALYNLIFTAKASFTFEDTQGTGRQDDTTELLLRSRWLIDNHWSLKGELSHDFRESTSTGNDFTNTRFTLSLVERL